MSMRFIQIHELISYPASNLNRDDLQRPKTVQIGKGTRLRISSQSLKRAWRVSDVMSQAFPEIGIRTNKLSETITAAMIRGCSLKDYISGNKEPTRNPVDKKTAKDYGIEIDKCLRTGMGKSTEEESDGEEATEENTGKKKKEKKKELFHYSPAELDAVDAIMKTVSEGGNPEVSDLLMDGRYPADIAMFGRMVAGKPKFKCEASVQVAHAFTVHNTVVESDFFTAVDDLQPYNNSGSGHIGELGFGAGLFYIYICVDFDLLVKNIGSEKEARKAVAALVEAAATVSPSGKQCSFASRAYASYILAEKGDKQPRSLASAFLKPVSDSDLLGASIRSIRETEANMDAAFGKCYDSNYEIDVMSGKGTLEGLKKFLDE